MNRPRRVVGNPRLLIPNGERRGQDKRTHGQDGHRQKKLPGFERKLRVALDWTLDLFFAPDIVYLRPLHTAQRAGAIGMDAKEAAAESPVT